MLKVLLVNVGITILFSLAKDDTLHEGIIRMAVTTVLCVILYSVGNYLFFSEKS